MRVHLTDIAVRAFKPTSHQKTYWDDTTPGFGVRVGKHAKTWTVLRGITRERVTIGRYPDLSLSEARTEAKKLLSVTPEIKRPAISFEEAKDLFLDEHYRDASPRTKYHAARQLKSHFQPLWPKNLSLLTDADIKRQLDKIGNTPSEQLHAYRVVRCFLRWCTRPPRRFIQHSPMEGYQPPSKDRKGTRVLTDQELRAVWKAADGPTYQVVRLLILWGTRQTETASVERGWVSDDVLTIPSTHTKNGRDHSIPILPLAREILDSCPKGKHFFPSRWGDSHLSDGAWSKIKRELQKASGTHDWKLRDLRRTFRSNIARLKVPRDIAEVLINHAPPILDEIYNRYDHLEEKRDALSRYETWLQTLLKN